MPQDIPNIAAKNEAALKSLLEGLRKKEAGARGFSMAAAKPPVTGGVMNLLKAGKYGAALKTPGGMLGALFLAQFLVNSLMKRRAGIQQMGLQEEAIGQQAEMSPEDMYYQAALPSLTQERRAAQDALIQSILGGRGQPMPVPGERRI